MLQACVVAMFDVGAEHRFDERFCDDVAQDFRPKRWNFEDMTVECSTRYDIRPPKGSNSRTGRPFWAVRLGLRRADTEPSPFATACHCALVRVPLCSCARVTSSTMCRRKSCHESGGGETGVLRGRVGGFAREAWRSESRGRCISPATSRGLRAWWPTRRRATPVLAIQDRLAPIGRDLLVYRRKRSRRTHLRPPLRPPHPFRIHSEMPARAHVATSTASSFPRHSRPGSRRWTLAFVSFR